MTFEEMAINFVYAFGFGFGLCVAHESTCDWLFGVNQYRTKLGGKGLKGWFAAAIAMGIVFTAQYDFIHLIQGGEATEAGILFSAGLVAGGGKKLAQRYGSLRKNLQEVQYTTTKVQK